MRRVALSLAAACLCLSGAVRADITGVVLDVTAGDTVHVLVREDVLKVHLRDIDAPEPGEPHAARARASLEELCEHKPVLLEDFGIEPRRHVVADALCAGVDAGVEQVRRGMAWVHEKSAPADSPLRALEREAKAHGRGVWGSPEPATATPSAH